MIDTFNCVYAKGRWGKDSTGKGTSGSGSTLEVTREYRAYLENFIKTHAVKSVVDAGCGDWTFSRAIDWGHASYLGIDIASDVIKAVSKKHEKELLARLEGECDAAMAICILLAVKANILV